MVSIRLQPTINWARWQRFIVAFLPNLFAIFLWLFFSTSVFGQEPPPITMNAASNSQTFSFCNALLYDGGGPTGNYAAGQSVTITICPSSTSPDSVVKIAFSQIVLAPGDQLYFFDGTSDAAPLIRIVTSNNQTDPTVLNVSATRLNTSRCVTVKFVSLNNSPGAAGWVGFVSCSFACQPVIAQLYETTPAIVPADTGYINLCIGQPVSLKARGVYPQNGISYTQNDSVCSFEWNFGDGSVIAYGPSVTKAYNAAGGYFINLTITDSTGKCRNSNFINQRVRVAPRPKFNVRPARDTLCVGDSLTLKASVNNNTNLYNVGVRGDTGTFPVGRSRTDSICIPDGDGNFTKTIRFAEFRPGSTLTDINDLLYIYVNMEHTWMRDIDISISCPSGRSVTLHRFRGPSGNEIFLGNADDGGDVNRPPLCPENKGYGWEYRWTPQATQSFFTYAGTIATTNIAAIGNPVGARRVLPPSIRPVRPNPLPPGRRPAWADWTGPLVSYAGDDPLTNLLGCPLNGDWSFTVRDAWRGDNGWVFAWGLAFNNRLYAQVEEFSTTIIDHGWKDNPFVANNLGDTITVLPRNSGTASFIYQVADSYNCIADTSFNVRVLPITHPNCRTCEALAANIPRPIDTAICLKDTAILNVSPLNLNRSVSFESFPYKRMKRTQFNALNPFVDTLSINSIRPLTITNVLTQIDSVCIDLGSYFPAFDQISLFAPNGRSIRLISGQGGFGYQLRNICFSPNAPAGRTVPTSPTGPFSGLYQPLDAWTALNGTNTNGNWLVKAHLLNGNSEDTLNRWSLTFKNVNEVAYTWTPTTNVVGLNTPILRVSPQGNTYYRLSTLDSFNCRHQDTILVRVKDSLEAPALRLVSTTTTSLTFAWDALNAATAYQVSVNGGTWISPNNGPRSHIVTRLSPTDTVRFRVRGIPDTSLCGAKIASRIQADACDFDLALGTIDSIACFGGVARVNLSSFNATQPTTYYIINNANDTIRRQLQNPLMEGLAAGTYRAFARDGASCRDSLTFTLTQPQPLRDSFRVDSVKCKNEDTGQARVLVAGGTAPYSYFWSSGDATDTTSRVAAGRYFVTITDANGCIKEDTVQIHEPDSLRTAMVRDSVLCFGSADGWAKVTATGGTSPYTYRWNNGAASTVDSVGNLRSRTYAVTVTDNKGCVKSDSVFIPTPDSIRINFTAQATLCADSASGQARAIPFGGTGVLSDFRFSWSNGDRTALADSLLAGLYHVTVTDANGCQRTDTVRIDAPPAITSVTAATSNRCYGDTTGIARVRANGGTAPYTFVWNNLVVDSVARVRAGRHYVVITDALGCRKRDSVLISQPDSIKFDSLRSTAALCNTTPTGTASAYVSGGTGAYTYSWSPSNQTTPTALNLIPRLYTITVRDANNCQKTDTVRVNATAPLSIDSFTIGRVRCFGEANGTLTVHPTGGAGGYTFQWSDAARQTTQTATNLSAIAYTVVVTDRNGCSITQSATVTQPNRLVASAVGDPAKCKYESSGRAITIVVGGTPRTSGSAYTYLWNDLNAQTDSIAINLKADEYIVTVTDANGCTDTARVAVGEPASGVRATASQTFVGCFGTATGRARVDAVGGTSPYVYAWSNGDNLEEARNLRNLDYIVTVTDRNGCSHRDTVTIQTLDSIQIFTSKIEPRCYGFNNGAVAVDSVKGGNGNNILNNYNFRWNTLPTQTTPQAIGLVGGRTYIVTITDANGCFNTVAINVAQPLPITLNALTRNTSCFGGSDGQAQVAARGSHNVFAYQWSANTNGTRDSAVARGLSVGSYSVTVTDSTGCRIDTTLMIGQPSRIRITDRFTENNKCQGDTLGSIDIRVSGGIPRYRYIWSTPRADSTPIVRGLRAGNYQVTISDQNGCRYFDTIVLRQPTAVAATLAPMAVKCFGDRNGMINIRPEGGTPPYVFSTNGTNFTGVSNVVGLRAGDYEVFVKDANNCLWFSRANVPSPPRFTIDAGAEISLKLGDNIRVFATPQNNQGRVTYTWTAPYDSVLSCKVCPSPLASPMFTVELNVSARDSMGCLATDVLKINVLKPRLVLVPTGFSPNSDGANDVLYVRGQEGVKIKTFRVYDRWGELLYEARDFKINDPTFGWDGTFRGQAMNQGIYVWYAEVEYIDGATEIFKGNTTLLR